MKNLKIGSGFTRIGQSTMPSATGPARAFQPLSPPLSSGQQALWQPSASSAPEWEQAKAVCRERLCAESTLRFHLRLALRRFAMAVDHMADRLQT